MHEANLAGGTIYTPKTPQESDERIHTIFDNIAIIQSFVETDFTRQS